MDEVRLRTGHLQIIGLAMRSEHLPKSSFVPDHECLIMPGSKEINRYACGHLAPSCFLVRMYGETSRPFIWKAEPEYCPSCLIKHVCSISTRCVICGRLIFEGEAVALYPAAEDGQPSIGCARMDCCVSGGLLVGRWTAAGIVPFFRSS